MLFECATVLAGMILLFILIHCDKMERGVKEHFKMLQAGSCTRCKRPAQYDNRGFHGKDECSVKCPASVEGNKLTNVCTDPLGLDGPLKYTDKGANLAFLKYLKEKNKDPTVQLGLLLEGPDNERVLNGMQSTGVNDPDHVFPSQRLVGPPNPKTLVAPVVPARSLDTEYWRTNNLVIRSGINARSPFDATASGYKIQPCPKGPLPSPPSKCYQLANTQPRRPLPCTSVSQPLQPCPLTAPIERGVRENFAPRPGEPRAMPHVAAPQAPVFLDNVTMDMDQGYNQVQTKTGLPSNLPTGPCQRAPEFKQFNHNVFTSTVSPAVYQNSQIIEPINSMIGISMTPQIPPTTSQETRGGDLMFEQHDPNMYEEPQPQCEAKRANTYNTTDPRFTGYGTSYRDYIDPMVGQPRFFYKDIDAIKMPNYICRSKIDVNNWADKYGPVPEGDECGNKYTQEIRTLADNAFLDATIQQRTELMQRGMRKRNAEMWQRKMYPINTSGQAGSCGACR
ncbi:MAG: hypothetical protein K0U52_06115 [Gammaproteobacteria bacterium]|jgi:hypothetical protein|nr:hypothetical protein [Gammaproteobacteria bacterium]